MDADVKALPEGFEQSHPFEVSITRLNHGQGRAFAVPCQSRLVKRMTGKCPERLLISEIRRDFEQGAIWDAPRRLLRSQSFP